MCRCWFSPLLMFLASSYVFAQNGGPDFSGVYLRNSSTPLLGLRPGHGVTQPQIDLWQQTLKTLDEGSPLILTVSQTTDEIKVTEIQNGVSSATRYRFHHEKSSKAHRAGARATSHARIKKDTLILDYTMAEEAPSGGTVAELVHERWNLSPASATLTIRSTRNGTETYSREASLQSASARAAQLSLANKCVCLRLPPGAPPPSQYKDGAALGFTVYRQLNRLITFDAGISGDFFKDLQRTSTPNGTLFRQSGRSITAFPDDVSLEISVRASFAYAPAELFDTSRDAPLPAELFSLRFQVRWSGPSTRELGELPSDLVTEPWRELRKPEHFYRIAVPATGVPLEDSLEVRILTQTGTQIGCIRGNI